MACWDGFKQDSLKVQAAVYAQPGDLSSPFQVGNLPENSKVCVSKKTAGYAYIQYEEKSKPGIPKFGYVKLANLKSSAEASSLCLECQTEEAAETTIPVVEGSSEDIRNAAQRTLLAATKKLGEPLPYADRIQQNVKYGLEVKKGFCARAVARILRAADLLPGEVGSTNQSGGFNGEDGYEYLSSKGFKDDPKACNRPGVVLIYGQAEPGYGKLKKIKGKDGKMHHEPGYLAGDVYGHAEILGTDGKYYYYNQDSDSLDNILGKHRRPLKHCMVSIVGMSGGKVL